jgi:uncharacterized SAM-binding protein YcdF (DUF218 family)
MPLIVDVVKTTLQPGSIGAILLLLTTGVCLLYARPRWGRVWLTGMVLGYLLLATPAGASLLARTVTMGQAPLPTPASANGAEAIVMLGGGSNNIVSGGRQLTLINRVSALRAIETARLYRLLGNPLVIVSGGVTDKLTGAAPESEAYRIAMAALGVPADRIVSEFESKNTHDEAVILKRMLAERHIERFVLVTSPLHMRRSLATFAAQGLHPVPSPAPLHADRNPPFPLWPDEGSLDVGNAVIYEWFARAYYWGNGWTRPADR